MYKTNKFYHLPHGNDLLQFKNAKSLKNVNISLLPSLKVIKSGSHCPLPIFTGENIMTEIYNDFLKAQQNCLASNQHISNNDYVLSHHSINKWNFPSWTSLSEYLNRANLHFIVFLLPIIILPCRQYDMYVWVICLYPGVVSCSN